MSCARSSVARTSSSTVETTVMLALGTMPCSSSFDWSRNAGGGAAGGAATPALAAEAGGCGADPSAADLGRCPPAMTVAGDGAGDDMTQ